MTATQMDETIQNYCSGRDCNDCKVRPECDHCEGSFRNSYPDLVLAYGKLTGSAVEHPSHYNQGSIECIDAMVAAYGKDATATFCQINAFKYVWRAEHKNGIQDIDKAIWYLNKFKELKSSE